VNICGICDNPWFICPNLLWFDLVESETMRQKSLLKEAGFFVSYCQAHEINDEQNRKARAY
jgi:hypothetical protein